MSIITALRRFPTTRFIDKLSAIVQSASHGEKQSNLKEFCKVCKNEELTISNTISSLMSQYVLQQPKKIALWTFEDKTNEHQTLTFNDINKQASRLANVLTGEEYGLKPGHTVLALLPSSCKERTLLFLACLQAGLIFSPYDSEEATDLGIVERIRILPVDCFITNEDNVDRAHFVAHTPFRPLKKACFMKNSTSRLLPVGWNQLVKSMNNADSHHITKFNIRPDMSVLYLLSENGNVVKYSQQDLCKSYISVAVWLNKYRTSHLIWMKNQNEVISLAPWLCGSSILYKKRENIQTIFNTLEKYQIDAFYGSNNHYEMIKDDQQENENKTNLRQLFASERINAKIKERWNSKTNLMIDDDYIDFHDTFMSKYFSNNVKPQSDHKSIGHDMNKAVE